MAEKKMVEKRMSEKKLSERLRPRCPDCKFRIRGENHDEGKHHKSGGKGKFRR